MKKAIIIIAILIVTIFFIGYPINLYLSTFKNPELSKNSSDWGNFSSYLSLIISTIIGLANLILLIYITKLVSGEDEKRSKRQIQLDDKRMLNQIIIKAHQELITAQTKYFNVEYDSKKLDKLMRFYKDFQSKYSFIIDGDFMAETFIIQHSRLHFISSYMEFLKDSPFINGFESGKPIYDLNSIDFLYVSHKDELNPEDIITFKKIGLFVFEFVETNQEISKMLHNFILNKENDTLKIDFKVDYENHINLLENNFGTVS